LRGSRGVPPRTLAHNTLWYGCVTIFGLGTGLVMSVILARSLGPDRMGDFSYASWFLRVLESVAALGFAVGTVRYTADALGRGEPARAAGFLRFFTRCQLVSALVVTLLVAPLVVVWAPPSLRLGYLVGVATLVPVALEGIFIRAIYGAQRYDITARVSSIKMTLSLLATALALWCGGGVGGVLIAQGLVTCISCLLQRHYVRTLYPHAPERLATPVLLDVRAFVIPLSFVMLLEMLVWDRTEIFFLRLYVPSQELAFYSLAYGLAGRLVVMPNIVIGPLLPAFAALHGSGDRQEFQRIFRRAVRYAMLVGAPIVAIGGAIAPGVVRLLYGDAYAPVSWMFRALVAVTLVSLLREVAWSALQAAGARRSILYGSLASTVVDLGLAVLLIPRLGTIGAVIAASTAQIGLSLWAVESIRRMKGATLPGAALVRIVAAALVACAVTLAIGSSSLALVLVGVAAGVVAFVLVGLALGVVERAEWARTRMFTGKVLGGRVAALLSR
jgi:O-antigen/teichoic acid export membrane protein